MKAPPKWAQELTIKAILHLQSLGYKADLPELNWRHGVYRDSSGHCKNGNSITVTAGRSRVDQKLVLLHEITHTVTECEKKYITSDQAKKRGWIISKESEGLPFWTRTLHHTSEFWDTAWLLYRWAKLPVRYCLKREQGYRKGAVVAYRRSR